MYSRYAERRRFKTELLSYNENGLGGFKEAVFQINGAGAYSRLKYESGVHRVQRIPVTETNGRIHTSTVTVAVLPEAEELDVDLDMNDVSIDVYRSHGHGGQNVNTTDSAVRVTHAKSGIVVTCQDEKSQHKNKDKALRILRAKLYELEQQRQHDEISKERRSQVGTGDRSERIRTYNYAQGRVSDHRINLTLYKLEAFLDGDLDEMTDALITTDQAEKLKGAQH
jgi:peptide chain release factor 1